MIGLQLGLLLGLAYLIGAIPTGLLVGRARGRDLLQEGSGKIGATNSGRVLGWQAAVVVFAGDLAKGMLAVALARLWGWPDALWAGLATSGAGAAAVAGHNWSVWVRLIAHRWGGGRGLVTALGALLLVAPLVAIIGLAGAGLGLVLSRYMVIGALAGTGATLATTAVLVAGQQLSAWLVPGIAAACLLIIAGFQDSLVRLRAGTETRLGHDS